MPARSPRVLLIAHDFPPAGGSGSNRTLAFARYAPMYGWRPTVLTVDRRFAANRDDGLLAELPSALRVVRTGSLEPAAHPPQPSVPRAEQPARGAPSALRRHLGHARRFPDAHVGWLPFALAAALREPFDVIHSTSGPFTSHVVGLLVHWLTGKPWVVELRDGWYVWNRAVFPDYPWWRGVAERWLENRVIRTASRVVLVTERMAGAFRRQYPDLPAAHFAVVSNGFDPAAVIGPETRPAADGFEVLHTGALYYGRSVASFLRAAERLEASFTLRLLGTLDAGARDELQRSALRDRVCFDGYVDHAQSLAAMRSADLLLLVANTTRGAEATVPGKLFEYLASGTPVLAIVPALESSTGDVLKATGAGWVARADDPEAIACCLREALERTHPADVPRALSAFDRRFLTRDLAQIFDDVRAAHRV